MNADGANDVVTVNTDAPYSVSLLLNKGAYQFEIATQANFPQISVPLDFPIQAGSHAAGLKVGDLNNDGAMDIVTSGTLYLGGTSKVSVILANP